MEIISALLLENNLYIVGLAAVALFGVAAYMFVTARNFVRSASKTQGTVVRLEARPGSKGGTVYLPIFEFKTIDGQIITVPHDVASRPPNYRVGESVEILYNPANPQNAKLAGSSNFYMLPALLAAFGAFAAVWFFVMFAEALFKSLRP
ncbi:MAG: DUF3592 domain-containing protein [Anaerolineales bacterium]|nr:DUF3592 domain-containing protein [Anaerolineales bacterium]